MNQGRSDKNQQDGYKGALIGMVGILIVILISTIIK